ncbi:MAG: type II toxin-antitoxin system death-on-curing family toxin [Deltaproteobacteria bacterium]
MNWITLPELVIIHERVIQETGGVHGVTNPGGLESALARPFTSFEGVALFPDLVSKVAALIHSIIAFHPFSDGNKRTALVAADVCLRLNGYRILPSEEVEPFFWAVARGERQVDGIAEWLRSHTEPWGK